MFIIMLLEFYDLFQLHQRDCEIGISYFCHKPNLSDTRRGLYLVGGAAVGQRKQKQRECMRERERERER